MENKVVIRMFLLMGCIFFIPLMGISQYTTINDSTYNSDAFIISSFKPILISNDKKVLTALRFDQNNLPFFCKIEHKIERGSKIGFRFRLGDLNYVNMLENKK